MLFGEQRVKNSESDELPLPHNWIHRSDDQIMESPNSVPFTSKVQVPLEWRNWYGTKLMSYTWKAKWPKTSKPCSLEPVSTFPCAARGASHLQFRLCTWIIQVGPSKQRTLVGVKDMQWNRRQEKKSKRETPSVRRAWSAVTCSEHREPPARNEERSWRAKGSPWLTASEQTRTSIPQPQEMKFWQLKKLGSRFFPRAPRKECSSWFGLVRPGTEKNPWAPLCPDFWPAEVTKS